MFGRSIHCLPNVAFEMGMIVNDDHGPAAEHIRRPNQERVSKFLGAPNRFLGRTGGCTIRLGNLELAEKVGESPPVFGNINVLGRRSQNTHALRFELTSQLERSLPTELNDRRFRPFGLHNMEDILQR